MKPLTALVLLLAAGWSVVTAEDGLQIQAQHRYQIKAAYPQPDWMLSASEKEAVWCFYSRGFDKDVKSVCKKPGNTVVAGTVGTVQEIQEETVLIRLEDGRSGYIFSELLGRTPEELRRIEAEKIAQQKRNAQRRAAEEATRTKNLATEAAYVASLPKLRSGAASTLLVATSADCARDYRSIIEFGRRSGTGVEFRKKLLELVSLGCAFSVPAGTPVTVSNRTQGTSSICSYPERKCGLALTEHLSAH